MRPWLGLLVTACATLVAASGRAELASEDRRSDTEMVSPSTRAMQADDMANPGMFAVLEGEALWNMKAGAAAKSCRDCHGDAPAAMRGVAARYPAWDSASSSPIDLAGRIDQCRQRYQIAPPTAPESAERLGLTAFVANLSRGMAITPAPGAGMDEARARGRRLFTTRIGQLNLACVTCHDDHWGRRLGGATIPQGHPVGYPIYRLEWQSVGSLQRRFRSCMTGVRSEPYAYDARELVDLEAYLAARASGLKIETPAVRP